MYLPGVFQIDREIFKNSIWNSIAEFRMFFYIVGNAIWKEEGADVGDIHMKRGQYLRSYRNLREDLMYIENNAVKYYSISYLKKIADKLEADKRIKREDTKLGTLFTVLNYSYYQGFDRFEQVTENAVRTEKEQRENNKKKDNKDNKKDIYVLPEDEEQFLETLSRIENYPVDRKKDLEMYHSLQERYPMLDVLEAIEQWRMYKLDKPLQKNSNPRSQINTAFRKYTEWGKCLKKEPESKRADIFRFEGSERRI